jgi:hypothetical protein
MSFFNRKKYLSVIFFIALAVMLFALILIFSFLYRSKKISFSCTVYLIYRAFDSEEVAAATFTEGMHTYGGAGYLFYYNDNYYAVASCYYSLADAEAVENTLLSQNTHFGILTVQSPSITTTAKNLKTVEGILNTLYEISSLFYGCANNLDEGITTPTQTRESVVEICKSLKALNDNSKDTAYSPALKKLSALCDDMLSGNELSSYSLRYLQMAALDIVLGQSNA